jgi:hypothetical protein
MRIARTLLLATLTAMAAMTLTTTSASAENQPVHVEHENEEAEGGTLCTDALDNCIIHAVGIGPESGGTETQLIRHPLGVVTVCEEEFEGEIFSEAGSGHFYFQEIHDGPSVQCNFTQCSRGEEEWPFTMHEEAGELYLQIGMCWDSPALGGEIHCDLEPEIIDEGSHHYIIDADNLPCQNVPVLEINGQWEVEQHPHDVAAHDDVVISHAAP